MRQVSEHGLSSEEAAARLAHYGPNKLPESSTNPVLKFLGYMWNPLSWCAPCVVMLVLQHCLDSALGASPVPLLQSREACTRAATIPLKSGPAQALQTWPCKSGKPQYAGLLFVRHAALQVPLVGGASS